MRTLLLTQVLVFQLLSSLFDLSNEFNFVEASGS